MVIFLFVNCSTQNPICANKNKVKYEKKYLPFAGGQSKSISNRTGLIQR